ncbi:MAG: hypothetical protein QM749_17140 [Aquabacterium sp.]
MKLTSSPTAALLLSTLSGLTVAATHPAKPGPSAQAAVVSRYLQQRGDLCLGKFDWPVDVKASDVTLPTRDAVQMPVLESVGLVSSSASTVAMAKDDGTETQVPATRYELTRVGKMFYLNREIQSAVGSHEVHHADLCAGKLSLDKVVSWTQTSSATGQQEATASYTYTFAPAQWTRFPQVLKVFPMIDRVEQGQRSLRMTQRFQLVDGAWLAVAP